MLKKNSILTLLLLLLFTVTAAAQDFSVLQGCRRGTPRSENLHLRRGGSEGKVPGGDYYHGERHQLTVLVSFNDRFFVGDEAATLEQWDKIFNAENLTEEPFKGSVHDYFSAQSCGDFNVVFDLFYVQVSGDAKKYASTSADDENSQYLVQDIMEVLLSRDDIAWDRYDWNGDGQVNQLLIIFAGKGSRLGGFGSEDGIWPHQWWLTEHLKDRQPGVYCDAIPVTYNDKQYLVDCYCALQELAKDGTYGAFGTLCHEYSHCFGFPDFYTSTGSCITDWDLMDRGNYNGGGFCPPNYSAHERWLMGWLNMKELNENTTVTAMKSLSDGYPEAYLIRNDGYSDEYYIVENRQKIGWDSALPGSGLVVFHVDFDPSIWAGIVEYPNSSKLKRYTIFAANNKTGIYNAAGWPYPYEGNCQLTNESTPAAVLNHPNTDDTKLMSKPITNMTVTGGLASFDFLGGSTGMKEVTTGADQLLYRFGSINIIRNAQGEIRKVIRK